MYHLCVLAFSHYVFSSLTSSSKYLELVVASVQLLENHMAEYVHVCTDTEHSDDF